MRPWSKLLRLRERDNGMVQRLTVLATVVLVLGLSMASFMNNDLHDDVDQPLGDLTAYLGARLGADAVVPLLMLATGLAGVVSERRLKWPLYLAWALYLPSVLYLSQIDWLYILGANFNLSLMKSGLPDAYIVLNGAALVGASVLLRSYRELRRLRQDLLDRGGSAPEVDKACARNMLFLTRTISISTATAAAIWGVVTLASSLGEGASAISSEMYLWAALIAMFVLLAMFAALVAGRDWIKGGTKSP